MLRGAQELRVKESDRIGAMADALTAVGIVAEPREDGMRVVGGKMRGGVVDSRGDHRIAMAMAVAGLHAEGEIVIEDTANIATSFPGFVALAGGAGLRLQTAE